MKKYVWFLVFSWLTALVFETIANVFFDGTLFKQGWNALPVALGILILWYGLIYSLAYMFFKNTDKLWKPGVYFGIFGAIIEPLVFHRTNVIADLIVYAIMGFIPFWLYRKYVK